MPRTILPLPPELTLTGQMREWVRANPYGIQAVSDRSGVDVGQLSKFANGKCGLGSQSFDRLFVAFNLKVSA